jgi:hypothetical protein
LIKAGHGTSGSVDLGLTCDIAPDGERFLLVKEAPGSDGTAPASVVIVLNWAEELRRLAARQ